MRSGEVDFGVVIEPSSADDLCAQAILSDPFVLVMPLAHILAANKSVRWTALGGQSLVLLDHASGSRRLIDEALAFNGATCQVKQELGHPTTVFRMIEAGIGIGIGISVMPALAIPPTGLPGLAVRPLTPRVQRVIMLVRRRTVRCRRWLGLSGSWCRPPPPQASALHRRLKLLLNQ